MLKDVGKRIFNSFQTVEAFTSQAGIFFFSSGVLTPNRTSGLCDGNTAGGE